jgi:hypothetical protein
MGRARGQPWPKCEVQREVTDSESQSNSGVVRQKPTQ